MDGLRGREARDVHRHVLRHGDPFAIGALGPQEAQQAIGPLGFGVLLLDDVGLETALPRQDPDLYELHLSGLRVIALRVLCAATQPHPLHTAGEEHAVVPEAVGVLELARDDVGDALDVAMRMHRPDRTRHERVVVEDPHRADTHMAWVVVLIEGEVPARFEPSPVDPVDRAIGADVEWCGWHRAYSTRLMIAKIVARMEPLMRWLRRRRRRPPRRIRMVAG